jgi:SAM-dependent methyltransferase
MRPKAEHARARGLAIVEDYLRPGRDEVDFVSVVDVFSHIPDFDRFLGDVRSVLSPCGEIFVETGNLADLADRQEFPGELGLPDHLVFAGEVHLRGYLERAGFEIVRVERARIDGVANLVKNAVKKLIGRPAVLGVPYTSDYRQLLVRARLRTQQYDAQSGCE